MNIAFCSLKHFKVTSNRYIEHVAGKRLFRASMIFKYFLFFWFNSRSVDAHFTFKHDTCAQMSHQERSKMHVKCK